MLSPLSKGLFHKAILQSGVSTCHWVIKETQQEVISFKLASLLGNDSKDPEEIVEFLRTIPADEIVKAQHQILTLEGYMNPHFLPMIDNDVKRPLFPHPIHQLVNDDNDIPIIVDYTSHECLLFLTDSSENHLNMIYEYELPNHVRRVGNLQDPVKISQLTERVKQWYFNGKPCTENSVPSIIQCMSDFYMNIPTTEFVNSRRKKKGAVTYFYKFSYIGDQTTTKHIMMDDKVPMTDNCIMCKILSYVKFQLFASCFTILISM